MGSNSSKGKKGQDTSQYGETYLQTDKTAYCAGDTVQEPSISTLPHIILGTSFSLN